MTIEEHIYATLSANAGVTALVPASRIKPPGDWQAVERPYLVHKPVTCDPTYTHESRAALTQWPNYQVSVVANDYKTARTVANSVIAALNGNQGGVQFFLRNIVALDYDMDFKLAEIALDFEVWEAL